jgi:predicted O-methyltransferase YrrM
MIDKRVQETITRLETLSKKGESYANAEGRFGWRNPIRADTGQILQALVLANNTKNALEVGTGYGLSTCYIASMLPRTGTLFTIEFDTRVAACSFQTFKEAGLAAIVKVINGDANNVLRENNFPQFDFVFLDAQKNQYLTYLNIIEERNLLAPGCLVVADNVIDRAEECAPFLEYVKKYPHIIIQTECGLLVAKI